MAPSQPEQTSPDVGRQNSVSSDEKTRPEPPHGNVDISKNTTITPCKEKVQTEDLKRKRSQDDDTPLLLSTSQDDDTPLLLSTSQDDDTPLLLSTLNSPIEHPGRTELNPIDYWRKGGTWPEEYFDSEGNNKSYLLARPIRGTQSETSSATSNIAESDQVPREARSMAYVGPKYSIVLAQNGSFLKEFDRNVEKSTRELCQTLLCSEQTYPQHSLFRDDLFDTTCEKIQGKNETMVIRDISQLIVPSAQNLATYGATHLNLLVESVNEGWNNARPFYGPRPQPDYSVGFRRSAFTTDQLERLKPLIGGDTEDSSSYFMATLEMHFPFLTCEVKSGAAGIDIADRQNAHSMTLAVRGVVELFRLVKREKELHRKILAFSVSHNHANVNIYGHYPIIDGKKTTFYRHPIKRFHFTDNEGKNKWTAYRFTKNVYDIWMPTHLKMICSAIDELPADLDVEGLEAIRLSQGLESHDLSSGHHSLEEAEKGSIPKSRKRKLI